MSTMLMPDESATAHEPQVRMLYIAANLLPPEIAAARRTRQVRRLVLIALAAFVVLLMAGYGGAVIRTSVARNAVSADEDRAQRLTRQQSEFAEVVRVQAESQAIRTQLSSLLAEDLQWSTLLASVQAAAPAGVVIGSLSGTLSARVVTAGAGAPAASGAAPAQVIGTLTVTGSAPTKAALAAYLDALATVPGLSNPLLGSANLQDGANTFSMQLDITDAVLGDRYAATSDKKPGEK